MNLQQRLRLAQLPKEDQLEFLLRLKKKTQKLPKKESKGEK